MTGELDREYAPVEASGYTSCRFLADDATLMARFNGENHPPVLQCLDETERRSVMSSSQFIAKTLCRSPMKSPI